MNHCKYPDWLCVAPSVLIHRYRGVKGAERKVGLSLLAARFRMSGAIPPHPICLHGDRNFTAVLITAFGNGGAACDHGLDIHLW